MHRQIFILFLFLSFSGLISAQKRKPKTLVKDSLSSEAFTLMVEQTLESFYAEYANRNDYNKVIDELEYEAGQIPDFTDDEICKHLKKINELSHFHLDCNPVTLSTIRFFQKNRRSFIRIALGRSKLYFDLYEDILAKYDLPLELRFLSVIESGLRPQVKSPAGALGLWQFMYGTGKMYGLKENSHFDERMDPLKSTDAACRYLKKLYEIYGDWNIALAAYNAGPGNINRAIRRSGGKKTYWELRPFLPRETQGYVPNFIAAAYLMSFHAEHNLVPAESSYHYAQLDTMCLRSGIHFETINSLISWDIEEIKQLNPVYKRSYIPQTVPNQCISGPLSKIGKLVSLEDSLYALEKVKYGTPVAPPTPFVLPEAADSTSSLATSEPVFIYHKVRKGETLSKIAAKYKVTNKEIMNWNKLRSTSVPAGKLLKISPRNSSGTESTVAATPKTTNLSNKNDSVMGVIYYDTVLILYHSVQRNETLESIAKIYNISKEALKQANNLSDNLLNIGQRLKINTTVQLSRPGMVSSKTEPESTTETPKTIEKQKPVKTTYIVRSGDLFNRIAQKHGLTSAQLQRLNPGVNPDRITIGQKLRVK